MEKLKLYPPLKEVLAFHSYPEIVKAFYNFDRGINKENLFGANADYYFKNIGLKGGHNGLDISCRRSTDIVASHPGWVHDSQTTDKNAGFGVVIVSNDEYEWLDGSKAYAKTIYWHAERNIVTIGEKVLTGQILAKADSTGFSTGDHLHFGLKKCDKLGNTLNWDNGHQGAIDPYPYLQYWDLNKVENKNDCEIDNEMLSLLYQFGFNREPDVQFWKGKSVKEFLKDALSQSEHQSYISAWKLGSLIIKFFKSGAIDK